MMWRNCSTSSYDGPTETFVSLVALAIIDSSIASQLLAGTLSIGLLLLVQV